MRTPHHLLASLWALLAALPVWAARPLLSPAELGLLLGQPSVRVIDIRPPGAYDEAHIPGAVSAPYAAWRGPASNPGELPDLVRLTALVRQLGLGPTTHAVVVSSGADATDFGASARVYWTLKLLGLKELSVLNGGAEAWAAARLPQNAAAVQVAASDFQPALDRSLIVTREELVQQIGSASTRLLDARPEAYFSGQTRHPAALVPGTLRGARNLAFTRWFAPDASAMRPADEVKQIAAESPAAGAADTVSFCNTGHWAAINWFALSEVAGQKNVRLYPGSLVEWTQGPGAALTMDQVPGRLGQLRIDFDLWMERNFP